MSGAPADGARGVPGRRRGLRPAHGHPSRSPRRRRLSKAVAKAPIAPESRRRNVDIPRFSPPPIPTRGAFATDLDKPLPEAVPRAPHAPPRPAEPVQQAAAIPPAHCRRHQSGSAGRRGPESTSSLVTAFPLLSTASPSTDCRPLLSRSGRATGHPVVLKGGSRILLGAFRVVARAENGAIAPFCDPRISERGVKSTREPPFRAAGSSASASWTSSGRAPAVFPLLADGSGASSAVRTGQRGVGVTADRSSGDSSSAGSRPGRQRGP